MQGIKSGAAAGGGESPIVKLFSRTLTSAASSLTIDLSTVDLSQYVELELCMNDFTDSVSRTSRVLNLTLSNGSESSVFGIFSVFQSYKHYLRCRFVDAGGLLLVTEGHNNQGSGTITARNSVLIWSGHPLADVRTMTLSLSDSGKLESGSVIVLYGLKK